MSDVHALEGALDGAMVRRVQRVAIKIGDDRRNPPQATPL